MMSFDKRFILLVKTYLATSNGKHIYGITNLRRFNTKAKSRSQLNWHKYLGTAFGVSSVTTLCAGIYMYSSPLSDDTLTNTNKDNNYSNDHLSDDYCSDQLPDGLYDISNVAFNDKDKMKSPTLRAIEQSTVILHDVMRVAGAPGLSICVSVKGKMIWAKGFGLADVEQKVPCHSSTVMRIASISKSLTMTAVARLIDQGKIDIEKSVQTYVPKYPTAFYKGKEMLMKVRHILSNTSGIRHYTLWNQRDKKERTQPEIAKLDYSLSAEERAKQKKDDINAYLWKLQNEKDPSNGDTSVFNMKEFFIKDNFSSVEDALQLFQNDELFSEPGKKFTYTTHGWTLVSAVIEGASGKKFETVMKQVFTDIGLNSTYFEKSNTITNGRARQYVRRSGHHLQNAPYVDNSYKYAGGGILSTVTDLAKFGTVMLYSYQATCNNNRKPKGYIKKHTMDEMWTPSPGTEEVATRAKYGLGWFVLQEPPAAGMCSKTPFTVFHTGHAIGGSSILLIRPDVQSDNTHNLPDGVVVAILTNLEHVSLFDAANNIAKKFAIADKKTMVVGRMNDPKRSNVYQV